MPVSQDKWDCNKCDKRKEDLKVKFLFMDEKL